MIVDASLVVRTFFPDEAQEGAQAVIREHVAGRVPLKAPDLLAYELTNAVWQAERRGRIDSEMAKGILAAMSGLQIELLKVGWEEMLAMARRFQLSAYDAAYLALAERLGETLMTGDERLFRAVDEKLEWVKLI